MKFFKTILIIAFAITISACSNDNFIIYEPGPQEYGWATGTKGGEIWEASGDAIRHWNDSTFIAIRFATGTSDGLLRESFSLSGLGLEIGVYQIERVCEASATQCIAASYYRLEADGDVIGASYDIDDGKQNHIAVTAIDLTTKMIQGNFQMHFKLRKDWGGGYPEKIAIKDGVFEVQLRD